MFKIKLNKTNKKYRFEKGFGVFMEGSLTQVTEFAIMQGLDQEELTKAYNNMSENLHTTAEFGMNGKFMFSHKEELENKLSLVH